MARRRLMASTAFVTRCGSSAIAGESQPHPDDLLGFLASVRKLDCMNSTKPLFVPLKTRYFRAFAAGTKTVEYRRWGARWNDASCFVGRPVVLSHGYSGARLTARVVRVRRVLAGDLPDPDPYQPSDELAAIELEGIGPG